MFWLSLLLFGTLKINQGHTKWNDLGTPIWKVWGKSLTESSVCYSLRLVCKSSINPSHATFLCNIASTLNFLFFCIEKKYPWLLYLVQQYVSLQIYQFKFINKHFIRISFRFCLTGLYVKNIYMFLFIHLKSIYIIIYMSNHYILYVVTYRPIGSGAVLHLNYVF